jgi:hypothetical protein
MTNVEEIETKQKKYHHVNSLWPDTVPELDGQEAIAAAKRLYRLGIGHAYKGKWKLTSGQRYTWQRSHVFYVNPKYTGRGAVNGWHDLVHFMSHYCHWKLHPGWKPHGPEHHAIERRMVEYVIANGWLDGKLKSKAKTATADVKAVRHARVLARIKTWQAKRKRADTALKKLERQRRYYERRA